MPSIVEVRDLHVAYSSRWSGETRALEGVSFALEAGEVLGVVGESGSGKSTLAGALAGLLPPGGRVVRGSVRFEGRELLGEPEAELRHIRGARLALIFQEASLALHPSMRVRQQVREVRRAHRGGGTGIDEAVEGALHAVFGADVARIGSAYPHELSGGQRQRVMLAQAMVCGPALLVADEPTASLDPVTLAEILKLFRELQAARGMALIFITHNPALLSGFAHRILVLYAGGVAECGPAKEVLRNPKHPYTKALLDCLPAWPAPRGANARLPVIPGDPPDRNAPPPGCRFEPRCAARMEECGVREPGATQLGRAHSVFCFKYGG